MKPSTYRDVLTLVRWDLRTIVRDPKTLLTMLLLPLVAYPAMLWSMSGMEDHKEKKRKKEVLQVAAPEAFSGWLKNKDRLEIVEGQLNATGKSVVDVEVTLPGDDAIATVRYRGDKGQSRRAKKRVVKVLKRQQRKDQVNLFKAADIPVRPQQVIQAATVDVSTASQRTGGRFGRMLPLTLVLLALGGGLYTALDLFAGERERGTMETLLVSRVHRDAVTLAKFLIVLGATIASAMVAMFSLGISLYLGWFSLPGSDAEPLTIGTLSLIGILSLPLLVQLSAGLVAMAARVPDYKTGQFLSMPVMLIALLPAALPLLPQVELGPLLALVPVSNIALTVVEVLSASPRWGMVALALGATVIHTGGALWLARAAMGQESAVLGPPGTAARHARGRYVHEAVGLFLLVLLLFWFIGQTTQTLDLVSGLVITQVVLIGLPGIGMIAWLGLPQKETLQARLPKAPDFGLAIVGGIATPCVGQLVFELQGAVIPASEKILEQFQDSLMLDLPLWALVVLIAVLPAIFEEILFRGAILGLLKKSMGPVARCLVVGILFGLLHLMLIRILPTGILGLIFTAAAIRSRSILVPMIMHLLNNGILVVSTTVWVDAPPDLPLPMYIAGSVFCVLTVAAMGRTHTR